MVSVDEVYASEGVLHEDLAISCYMCVWLGGMMKEMIVEEVEVVGEIKGKGCKGKVFRNT